jgi:cell wall-associated NlpC family hydrolase
LLKLLVGTLVVLLALSGSARSEESFGDTLRKAFATTPTPRPSKTQKAGATKKKSSSKTKRTATPTTRKKAKQDASPSPTPAKRDDQNAATSSSPAATATPSASPESKGAPATLASDRIAGYEGYSPELRKVLDLSLDLTRRNLQYKYGSADPSAGGMDCSGFIYYVLSEAGLKDVPRDSSEQYVWLRKLGTFRAVNSNKEDNFELDELKPGDLLFWVGTYNIERDPPITHTMVYLGREKGSNKRVMVGASDGRTYNGEARYGVSVFDFKVSMPTTAEEAKLHPRFIGYAHVPGLND